MHDEIKALYEHLIDCHLNYLDNITDELMSLEEQSVNDKYNRTISNKISKLNILMYKIVKEVERIQNKKYLF